MTISTVLVRTEYSSNIGASARAMANCGSERLILVDPQCSVDNRAHQMAAGAQSTLEKATVYSSWKEFYQQEPDGIRVAMTRRGGRKRKVLSLDELFEELDKNSLVYFIFGPEADGLASEDLDLVNYSAHLPVFGDFSSFNLAQAVLLTLFLTRQKFPPHKMPAQLKGRNPKVAQPLYFPDQLIKDWLTAMGFDVSARRSSAFITLRRLFLQNRPTAHEIQVLESILQQNIRKLKSINLAPK